MNITEVFFEEIFYPIIGLWKQEYQLEYGNNKHTFIASLGADFDIIGYAVEFENLEKKYNPWHFLMVFMTYQVLTEKGLELLKSGNDKLIVKNIPITDFENHFLGNLRYEGNEMYLENYKGFKDIENYRKE